ncbi:MAG: hypothetical protein OXC17_10330 [Aestuariivita sp.]|nr:hypothetical protein [Aestuariivita sp.]
MVFALVDYPINEVNSKAYAHQEAKRQGKDSRKTQQSWTAALPTTASHKID